MQLSNPVLLIKLKELNEIETDDEFSLNEEIEKLFGIIVNSQEKK